MKKTDRISWFEPWGYGVRRKWSGLRLVGVLTWGFWFRVYGLVIVFMAVLIALVNQVPAWSGWAQHVPWFVLVIGFACGPLMILIPAAIDIMIPTAVSIRRRSLSRNDSHVHPDQITHVVVNCVFEPRTIVWSTKPELSDADRSYAVGIARGIDGELLVRLLREYCTNAEVEIVFGEDCE